MPDEALFLLHWLALVLRMYRVPMYLLPWVSLALSNWWDKGSAEWISLIAATVIAFSIFACAFHVIRLPLPSAHPLSPVPYPAVSFVCRAASLIFYVKCFSSTLQNLNEQMTRACLLLVTYIGLQKAFSKDSCLTDEYILFCSWIAGSFQGPSWTKNLVKWDNCVEIQGCF